MICTGTEVVCGRLVACSCASNLDRALAIAAAKGLPAPTQEGEGISVIMVFPALSRITRW